MAKHLIPIHLRTTREYVAGWKDLDEWEVLTNGRQTLPRLTDDDGEGNTTHRFLVVISPLEWEWAKGVVRGRGHNVFLWVAQAIRDTLASSCQHEHDCCGCVQRSASVTYLGKRKFSVSMYGRRNI